MTDFSNIFMALLVQTNTKTVSQTDSCCQSFKITLIYCQYFLSGTTFNTEDIRTYYSILQLKLPSKMYLKTRNVCKKCELKKKKKDAEFYNGCALVF